VFAEIGNPLGVNNRGRAGNADCLAQKRSLFVVAFDQVDLPCILVGERTGDRQSGKTGARTKIDPFARLRRQAKELKRVGDVARPKDRRRRGRDQIQAALPIEQKRGEAIETSGCFT